MAEFDAEEKKEFLDSLGVTDPNATGVPRSSVVSGYRCLRGCAARACAPALISRLSPALSRMLPPGGSSG